MSRRVLGLWIVVVWVALWGDLTVANVLGGCGIAAALLVLFPAEVPREGLVLRPLPGLRFAGRFLADLVRATADVAWDVVTPRSKGDPGIVAVALPPTPDPILTVVADAVTLTPGTLTLEAESDVGGAVLYVHVLHLRDPEAVRADVRSVHRRAVAAFGAAPGRTPALGGPSTPSQESGR